MRREWALLARVAEMGGGHGLSAPGAAAPAQPSTAKPGVVTGVLCDVGMTLGWGRCSKSLGRVSLRLKTSGISLVMCRALRKVDLRPHHASGGGYGFLADQVSLLPSRGTWVPVLGTGQSREKPVSPTQGTMGLQAQGPGESNLPPLLAFPAVCQAQPGGKG